MKSAPAGIGTTGFFVDLAVLMAKNDPSDQEPFPPQPVPPATSSGEAPAPRPGGDGAAARPTEGSLDEVVTIEDRIRRLDELIGSRPDGYKGLGIRLALGMAQEIREGVPVGSRTAVLVSRWQEQYPEEWVEEAIAHARAFLTQPARLREEFSVRLAAFEEDAATEAEAFEEGEAESLESELPDAGRPDRDPGDA